MKKILILFVLLSFYLENYAQDMMIEAVADEATISFEDEEFSAKGGLKTKYEDVKIQANKIKKVKDKNIIIAHDKIYYEQQDQKVEAEELRLRLDDKVAIIKDGKSYTKVEGDAKAPHDRLYYGGEKFEARFPNKAIVRNAYFSTCSHIVEGKEKAHYRLESKKIVVYVGKRVVAYNNFLYIKNVPVLWLPIYVTSLKSTAEGAPLFPRFGADADGTYVIWGLDYGEDDSKYLNGSVALKWSSLKGWVLDSWSNTYTIEKGKHYGNTEFVDTYPFPKDGYEKEWKFKHKHHYGNDNGTFDWEYSNESTSSLNDESKEYLTQKGQESSEKIVVYKLNSKFTNIPTLYPGFVINLAEKIYPNFEQIAKNGTYTLDTKVEWTDQKDILKNLGEKEDEDGEDEVVGYTKPDREVLLEGTLTKKEKNNRYDYKIHYKKLEDFNPGNSADDTASKEETQDYALNLNKYKIGLSYGMTDRDQYRVLTTAEKAALDRKEEDAYGVVIEDADGDPIYINKGYEDIEAVKKYDVIKKENYKANIGTYEIFKTGLKWGAGYSKTESETKLNTDTYIDTNGEIERFNESSESVPLEEIANETKYTFDLDYKKTSLDLSYSENYKKKIIEPEIEGEENDVLEEDFEQMGAKISNNNIDIKYLGILGLTYDYAKDFFKEKDEREKNSYTASWSRDIYDTTGNPDSSIDLKLHNKVGYSFTEYSYSIGDRMNYEEQVMEEEGLTEAEKEELRKTNTEEYFWENRLNTSSYRMKKSYDDTVTFDLGNTKTTYTFDLDRAYNGFYYDWQDEELLENESMSNSITFNIDGKKYLSFKVTNGETYDSRKPSEEAFKNTDKDSYAIAWEDEDYGALSYSKSETYKQQRGTTPSAIDPNNSVYYLKIKDKSVTDTYTYAYGDWKATYSDTDTFNRDFDYLGEEIYDSRAKKNTKTYKIDFAHGEIIKRTGSISFSKYTDYAADENSTNTITFNFAYTDKRDELEEKIEEVKEKYVDEENKEKFVLSDAEKQKILDILEEQNKNDLGFSLQGLLAEASEDAKKITDNKKKEYKFELKLINEKKYQEQSDYWSSLTKIVVGPSIEYHKFYFSYKYTQDKYLAYPEAGSTTDDKGYVKQRLHYSTGHYIFGADDAWKVQYELKFNDALTDRTETSDAMENKRLKLYNIGIEKNFHCAVLGLSYGQELTEENSTYFYESLWTFKFGLLTFPEKKLGLERVRDDGEYVIEKYLGM